MTIELQPSGKKNKGLPVYPKRPAGKAREKEEMDQQKIFIYVVRNEWAMDGETDIVEEAFSTYEKAKTQFEKDIQKAKTEDPLLGDENCVIGEADDSFYLYEDGNANENHLNIYILKMEVK